MRYWRAPERHDPIAHELVERALVLEHGLDHLLEVLVQHLDQRLRPGAFAHPRETADVGVEHRALLHERSALLDLELAAEHALGDVRRKQAAEALAVDDLLLDL